ncbi:MAG: glycosyltransferase family 2 protein, partial [Conexibacter sp.]|nr:glycosyltransferase family 2 protein [Conexibacter sp.]
PLRLETPSTDAGLAALARPHPARPVPPDHVLWHGGDHRLFWTLSIAVTDTVWNAVGGFCEDYVGYGGEDTDFGQLARAAGVDVCWVGGAWAYHQHHATHDPPVQHRDAIERNAALFHRRWGWWPMEGWLAAFDAADRALRAAVVPGGQRLHGGTLQDRAVRAEARAVARAVPGALGAVPGDAAAEVGADR